ncbi:hypothetical protein [Aliikangiella sp. IMCC44359]|uniref:hypothetical protein n=1 Tax=Aliikangiella sp. IMCC44359 TaxID=3459125 RepID=UPI00403B37C9
MIEYKYPEEKEITLHYARLLNDSEVEAILIRGYVKNSSEALRLKDFYWVMVEQSVKDQGEGVDILMNEGIESWMEYIFHSFNGYLVSSGYETEWDVE